MTTPKGSFFERIDCDKEHEHVKKGAKRCATTWWARVRYVDPETNKPRDLQRRSTSRSDAIDKRDRLIAEIKATAGRSVGSERMTVADLCDYYQKHHAKPAEYVGDRKVAGLRSWYTVHKQLAVIKDYFGVRKLGSVTYGACLRFKQDRLQVKTNAGKQRTIASVNRELALLRSMLNVALAEGWITVNPFSQGKPLISNADEKKRERIITAAEEKALLDACNAPKRHHLRAIVIAALDTGCRRGELLKLRWQDISFASGQIRLIAFNTKTADPRTVAMTTRLRGELERLKAEAPDNPLLTVFGGLQSVKKSFAGARKDAGLLDLRFHDLRHTNATRQVKEGIPLPMVGKNLGHKNWQTTLRYVNADTESAYQSAAALDRFNSLPLASDAIDATELTV